MEKVNKSLFHISQEFVELEGSLLNDPENESIGDRLEIAEKDLLKKAEVYHALIRKHKATEQTIKDEIIRLEALLPRHVGLQSRLKQSLLNAVLAYGPISGDTWRVSSGKSKKLEIFAEDKLPPWFFNQVKTPDKTKIKQAIKDGEEVKGARIIEGNHILIK